MTNEAIPAICRPQSACVRGLFGRNKDDRTLLPEQKRAFLVPFSGPQGPNAKRRRGKSIMTRPWPFAAAMLAMSSCAALAQTSSPPATEAGKARTAGAPGSEFRAPPSDVAAPTAAGPAAALTTVGREAAPGVSPVATMPPEAAIKEAAKVDATLTQSPGDIATSTLVGARVYNQQNEHIGEVEDIIISSSGAVTTVVIGVGGFLGIGEKKVAMPFAAMKPEKGDNRLIKIVVDQSRENLKKQPSFKYASNW